MNPKLRKMLEANGLRKDATEQEAWAKYDEMKERGFDFEGIEIGTRSAATVPAGGDDHRQQAGPDHVPAGQEGAQRTYTQQELDDAADAATDRALASNAQRQATIQDMIDVAGLGDVDDGNFARGLLGDYRCSVEQARKAIFAKVKETNRAFGAGAHGVVTVGVEAGQKLRAAISDGLALRAGIRIENPAEGAREFRGRSLVEVSRELLEAAGISCRGLSNAQVATRAISSGSSSDLPAIFGGLMNQRLIASYNVRPASWRPFVAVTQANDFKEMHAIKLSEGPDLKGLNENGEYQTASFSDSKESYRVITKGIKIPITRTMIINDDMRALTRIPNQFGAAARRFENASVYSLINSNAAMSDGKALFHADHKNLADTAAALSSTSLSAGRASMRLQTGLDGAPLDIEAAFLLTPVIMETDAEVLLRSMSLPDANMSAGVYNPHANKLVPISDPLLDVVSETAWYLMSDPAVAAMIEVAWLEGEEQPYVEEQIDFNSDSLIVKVRHDFGAGVVDHVGGYKNAGA